MLRIIRSRRAVVFDNERNARKALEDWNVEYPYQSREDLLIHAQNLVNNANDYYKKIFSTEGEDLYHIRQVSEAAQIFNPIYLKDMDETTIVTDLYYLADKFSFFEYKQFTHELMVRLKQEMKALVDEAKRDHHLDRIIPSKTFKTRMEKRVKRNKLGDNHGLTWEDDNGEYASRIWAWWKPRVDTFP